MGTWWLAVLIVATTGCLVVGNQEVRVPPGANITVLCNYGSSAPRQQQRVKHWYRQGPAGLVLLGRTNGWVAPSHKGRLTVSDLGHSSQVQVTLVDVDDADSGEYCCAFGMLLGVKVIQRILIHVSRGMETDQMDEADETQTPDSQIWMPKGSSVISEDLSPISGVWDWTRWLLFWLMSSGAVLSSLIIALRRGGLGRHDQSTGGHIDINEETL